jgi:hypothetical protein
MLSRYRYRLTFLRGDCQAVVVTVILFLTLKFGNPRLFPLTSLVTDSLSLFKTMRVGLSILSEPYFQRRNAVASRNSKPRPTGTDHRPGRNGMVITQQLQLCLTYA